MENKTIFCRELAVVDEIEENLGNRIATLALTFYMSLVFKKLLELSTSERTWRG